MPFACYFFIFINVGLGELSLAGTASGVIGLNGYVTIPLIISGSRRTLIIQWGQARFGGSGGEDAGYLNDFPFAFPSACSLSNICRFAGHLSHFYSVAQHAVLCSQLVPQEFAFEALMHDATEAYCQDIPAPLKRLLPDYKRMEEKIDAVIREKYGLPPVMSTPVKYADLIMLATERRDLGLDDGSFWPVLEGIPATEMFNVIPLAPGHAYGMFMERFNELSELRKCA